MNCPYCGQKLLEPPPPSCPNCRRILSPGSPTTPPRINPREFDFDRRKGIADLRNAFLLYLIGTVISLVPVIGGIGGIIDFVGFILLIMGWRALGNSSLKESDNYRSTGRWLIFAIIIVIIVAIFGTAAIISSIISIFAANPGLLSKTHPPSATTLSELPGFSGIFTGIVVEFAIILTITYATWLRVCGSMKRLSQELSQQRLRTAANLYILMIFLSAVGVAGLIIFIALGKLPSLLSSLSVSDTNFTNLGVLGYIVRGGYWTLLGVGAIADLLIVAAATYLAYAALNDTSKKIEPATLMPPPPGAQFCPNCGHAVDQSNNFCPACGTKLR